MTAHIVRPLKFNEEEIMNHHEYEAVAADMLAKINAGSISHDEFLNGQCALNLAATMFETVWYAHNTGRILSPEEVRACREEGLKVRQRQADVSRALIASRITFRN